MNCSILVANGPNYAGLGQSGEGFTSFSIASPTGEGLTRPRTFSRIRRVTVVWSAASCLRTLTPASTPPSDFSSSTRLWPASSAVTPWPNPRRSLRCTPARCIRPLFGSCRWRHRRGRNRSRSRKAPTRWWDSLLLANVHRRVVAAITGAGPGNPIAPDAIGVVETSSVAAAIVAANAASRLPKYHSRRYDSATIWEARRTVSSPGQ